MQSQEVISVNFLQMIISLLNLVIVFFIMKKFLFKPVKKIFAQRKDEVDKIYETAKERKTSAEKYKEEYEKRLKNADDEAKKIIENQKRIAMAQSEKIIKESEEKAESMIKHASDEIERQKQIAQNQIKYEIVEISSALAQKMLCREINKADHRKMIEDFTDKIGGDEDG